MTNATKGAFLALITAILAPLVGTGVLSEEGAGWVLGIVSAGWAFLVLVVPGKLNYKSSAKRIPDA